jgi:hypothetical protein
LSVTALYLQTNPLVVDLVGEENTGRLADTIKLLVMQVRGDTNTTSIPIQDTTYPSCWGQPAKQAPVYSPSLATFPTLIEASKWKS